MDTKKEIKQDKGQSKESKPSFNLPKVEVTGNNSASALIPKMINSGLTTESAMELLGKSNDKQVRNLLREALRQGVKQGYFPILLRAGSTKIYSLVKPQDKEAFKKASLKAGYTVEEKLPKSVRLALKAQQA